MNMKRILYGVGLALILATARTLSAQTGCVDSPEDPTLVLALIGALGALGTGLWTARSRRVR